jgi:site-specific recombinase XerD
MSKDLTKRQNNLGVMLATKPSVHTRKAYMRALDTVAQLATNGVQLAHQFPFELLSPSEAQKLLVALSVNYSASTTGITLAALRAYWKQAWMNDDISHERYLKLSTIKAPKSDPSNTYKRAGKSLTKRQLNRLFTHQADTAAGVRNRAILSCLFPGGMRKGEVCTLRLQDYSRDTGELFIRWGKGRKNRTIILANGALDNLHAWLDIRGELGEPLFTHVFRNTVVIKPLSHAGLWKMVRRSGDRVGIPGIQPHDLRHSTATHMNRAGVPLAVIAKYLGHQSITTTTRYIQADTADIADAASRLTVPTG